MPGPYLELFARRGRPGDVFGNEVAKSIGLGAASTDLATRRAELEARLTRGYAWFVAHGYEPTTATGVNAWMGTARRRRRRRCGWNCLRNIAR